MWIFKWILIALVMMAIILFAIQNTGMTNEGVQFLQWESGPLPMWAIMYAAFAAGVLFWLVVSIFQIFSLKNENRKARREIRKLRDELDKLRNVAVDESPIDYDGLPDIKVEKEGQNE
jgi:uncharacterized integral membrane protein